MRQITIRVGKVGLQFQCGRVLGNGVRYVAVVLVYARQIAVRVGECRIDLYGTRVTLQRAGYVALLF